MSITNEQKNALVPYIDDLDSLIKTNDVNNLLEAIDNIIVDHIVDNNDEPDKEAIELQKIYDQISNQN